MLLTAVVWLPYLVWCMAQFSDKRFSVEGSPAGGARLMGGVPPLVIKLEGGLCKTPDVTINYTLQCSYMRSFYSIISVLYFCGC